VDAPAVTTDLDLEVEFPEQSLDSLQSGMKTQALVLADLSPAAFSRLVVSVNGLALSPANAVISSVRRGPNGQLYLQYRLHSVVVPARTFVTVATPNGAALLRTFLPAYTGAPVILNLRSTATAFYIERLAAANQLISLADVDMRAINLLESRLIQAYGLGWVRPIYDHPLIISALQAAYQAFPTHADPFLLLPVSYSGGGSGGGGGAPAVASISVSGTLQLADETPVAGARVLVDGATETEVATSTADGSFTLSVAAPIKVSGSYRLIIEATSANDGLVQTIVSPGDQGTIVLPAPTIPSGAPAFDLVSGVGVLANDVSVSYVTTAWIASHFPLPAGWYGLTFANYGAGIGWSSGYRDVVMPLAADQLHPSLQATNGDVGTSATGLHDGDLVPLYRYEPWWWGGTWRQVNPGLVVKANASAPADTWASKISTAGLWAGGGIPDGQTVVVARIYTYGYYGVFGSTVAQTAGSGLVVQF
jgi:hypothetical protein